MTQITKDGVTTTTKPGQEQHKSFDDRGKLMYQYDYRHTDGKLFSCVADTLEKCRERRDRWLKDKKVGEVDRLNEIYDSYKHEFEGDFHNMLWQILVSQVFEGKQMAFTSTVGDPYGLGIAEADKPGYIQQAIFFVSRNHDRVVYVVKDLNDKVFGLDEYDSCDIVLSSMFADKTK